jgi:hypothetical protein
MTASLGVALAIVFVCFASAAPNERLGLALRATARWSFALFWLASTGGALSTLFGARFRALAHSARDFGLAFASAHLVHVGLVAWLYYIAVDPPLSRIRAIFFSGGVFWTYLLAVLSIQHVSARLDPVTWRRLRVLGVEYISLVFIADFLKKPFHGGTANLVIYVPFVILALAAPLLRLTAWVKRLHPARTLAV